MSIIRDITLNTGASMPVIGLGTYCISDENMKSAVEAAIDAGYRHFDCAFTYGNECSVGRAIKGKIASGDVKREDIFITTKLWCTYYGSVREAFATSLKRLDLEYIDLYVMHFPFAFQFVSEEIMFPKDGNGKILNDESIHYIDVWREMEKLKSEGLAKAIGICNFNEFQINKLMESANITPAVHQYEIHPYLDQEQLLQFCKSKNLAVVGYSPLGSPNRPWVKSEDPNLLQEPIVESIAKKMEKPRLKFSFVISCREVLLLYRKALIRNE